MRKLLPFVVVGSSVAGAFLACGPKSTPAVSVSLSTDAGASEGGEAGAPVWPEAGAPVAEAGAPIAAPDGGTLVPPNIGELLDGAIDLAMKAVALKDAPGMAPEGAPGRATLAENEHFGMIVTLQPNRCYTFVAFSPIGQVTQLEVKLLSVPPFFNVPAGSSPATDKNTAIIGRGKGAMCPILPVPIAYKLDVAAKKGGGRIGVQVFAKNK